MRSLLISLVAIPIYATLLGYWDFKKLYRDIQISRAPVTATAILDGNIIKTKSRKSYSISYALKYKFYSVHGEFNGIIAGEEEFILELFSYGAFDVVYFADNPSYNVSKSYYVLDDREKYLKSFSRIFIFTLLIAIPTGFGISASMDADKEAEDFLSKHAKRTLQGDLLNNQSNQSHIK